MKAARTRALNRKHAGTSKHAGTAKHTPTAHKKAATAHGQVARRTAKQVRAAHLRALGCVASCSAEAVGMSLRLAGWPVTGQDVLALYRHTADSPDTGASIWRTLEAAMAFGLAGVRPATFQLLGPEVGIELPHSNSACILGLDLPEGPHAVTLDASGAVWSWGALHEMTPEAVVEEAWAVTWP